VATACADADSAWSAQLGLYTGLRDVADIVWASVTFTIVAFAVATAVWYVPHYLDQRAMWERWAGLSTGGCPTKARDGQSTTPGP
jgi:hypothetical protein